MQVESAAHVPAARALHQGKVPPAEEATFLLV